MVTRTSLLRSFLTLAGIMFLLVPSIVLGLPASAASTRVGDRYLPASHLTLTSAISVDLTTDTVRLPLHRGNFHGMPVWYIITDASNLALAHDLGVNYADKISNIGNGCPQCLQNVTQTPQPGNLYGEAIINFQGVPDFRPMRVLIPGPHGFPPSTAQPGAVGDAHYSPFIRLQNTAIIYNAPIIATGAGPFDVVHHTNTADRVLSIDTKNMTVDLLAIRGYASGQPILYLSTDASNPLAATLERATYVPLLNQAPFPGGDGFLGSARERIYAFINGQTGPMNPNAQGLNHLVLDGLAAQEATVQNTALLTALSHGGDALNIQGNFPTELTQGTNAYSPLWDVQLSQWTQAAINQHRAVRLTREADVLNAVARGDVTGPGGAPYGAAGFVVNCPAIGFLNQAPTAG